MPCKLPGLRAVMKRATLAPSVGGGGGMTLANRRALGSMNPGLEGSDLTTRAPDRHQYRGRAAAARPTTSTRAQTLFASGRFCEGFQACRRRSATVRRVCQSRVAALDTLQISRCAVSWIARSRKSHQKSGPWALVAPSSASADRAAPRTVRGADCRRSRNIGAHPGMAQSLVSRRRRGFAGRALRAGLAASNAVSNTKSSSARSS
jgi:hypothetical protein